MPEKHPKRPRDPNQLAKLIVDISIGEVSEEPLRQETPTAAAKRRAGLKGGQARARKLSAKRRHQIAKKGAAARWKPTS